MKRAGEQKRCGGVEGVRRMGCIVMASGVGRRFGSQKLLVPFRGVPLLEQTLRCIPLDLVEPFVVTRDVRIAELCERLDVPCAVHDGPLQSDTIRCGLERLGDKDACMFLQGDQPLVERESMRALAREALQYPNSIVRLRFDGRAASPVVFPASLFDALRAIEGDKGGSALFSADPALKERIRFVEACHEWELWDVDTLDDLERLERVGGKGVHRKS